MSAFVTLAVLTRTLPELVEIRTVSPSLSNVCILSLLYSPLEYSVLPIAWYVKISASVCGLLVMLATADDDNLANAALVGANKVTPSPLRADAIPACPTRVYRVDNSVELATKSTISPVGGSMTVSIT